MSGPDSPRPSLGIGRRFQWQTNVSCNVEKWKGLSSWRQKCCWTAKYSNGQECKWSERAEISPQKIIWLPVEWGKIYKAWPVQGGTLIKCLLVRIFWKRKTKIGAKMRALLWRAPVDEVSMNLIAICFRFQEICFLLLQIDALKGKKIKLINYQSFKILYIFFNLLDFVKKIIWLF